MNRALAAIPSAEADAFPRTLLEADFPFAEVSAVARRDRYCNDHTYAVHKWWARRPPAVIRALLLAASLPASTSREDFWQAFSGEEKHLSGKVVGDPFMGGATTLVEAARLGADVTGIDVDPLAVRVARVELAELDAERFAAEAEGLLGYLRGRHAGLFPASNGREALHYFRLRELECGQCGESSLIFRNLWLARDRGLDGAVVRDEGGVVFCPICNMLHRLNADRKRFECCGRRHRIDAGTYVRGRFECPGCAHRASNEELRVGKLESRLIAIEETVEGAYRALRSPQDADRSALEAAGSSTAMLTAHLEEPLGDADSGRPASYGFETVGDLFHPRQKLVLADAFAWIRERESGPAREAMLLAVSNALGANNVLCGYATDYGRISSLFSAVRAYSMPVLSIELNPLHRSAGRGTLAATLRRIERSAAATVRRNALDPDTGETVPHEFVAHGAGRRAVRCSSADRALPTDLGLYDLALTDPPYFDFIPYSDLSLIYRAWLAPESKTEELGGAPIYPVGEDPSEEFATRLAAAFRNVGRALKPGAPLIFTYHSPHAEAWEALGAAIESGDFAVHAVFPVWADGRGGSHGHAGNCEWDLVFVCRSSSLPRPGIDATFEGWTEVLAGEDLEQSDLKNLGLGLEMAKGLVR